MPTATSTFDAWPELELTTSRSQCSSRSRTSWLKQAQVVRQAQHRKGCNGALSIPVSLPRERLRRYGSLADHAADRAAAVTIRPGYRDESPCSATASTDVRRGCDVLCPTDSGARCGEVSYLNTVDLGVA